MQLLSELLDPAQIRLHEDFGLPSLGREAVYFAMMGHEALHGRPNTVPSCTGAGHSVVMGKIVPGQNYRSLMRQVSSASGARRPRQLVVVTERARSE
jgi:anhydro-N-acetylmuramic acid kinase